MFLQCACQTEFEGQQLSLEPVVALLKTYSLIGHAIVRNPARFRFFHLDYLMWLYLWKLLLVLSWGLQFVLNNHDNSAASWSRLFCFLLSWKSQ